MNPIMSATVKVKLVGFAVPDIVRGEAIPKSREEGFSVDRVPQWRLEDLEPETLSHLCDEFRAAVFTKAKKADPRAGGACA